MLLPFDLSLNKNAAIYMFSLDDDGSYLYKNGPSVPRDVSFLPLYIQH